MGSPNSSFILLMEPLVQWKAAPTVGSHPDGTTWFGSPNSSVILHVRTTCILPMATGERMGRLPPCSRAQGSQLLLPIRMAAVFHLAVVYLRHAFSRWQRENAWADFPPVLGRREASSCYQYEWQPFPHLSDLSYLRHASSR